jgi:adenylylsulfate kinase-like enzyme
LATCESRDRTGLYRCTRPGEVRQVCGIDAVYQAPIRPAQRLDAAHCPPAAWLAVVLSLLLREGRA